MDIVNPVDGRTIRLDDDASASSEGEGIINPVDGSVINIGPAAPKRQVGFGEALGREAWSRVNATGETIGNIMALPFAGLSYGANKIGQLFGASPTFGLGLGDQAVQEFVTPAQQAQRSMRINPQTEELTGLGQVGRVLGSLGGAVPEMVMGGMATKAAQAPRLAVDAAAPFIQRYSNAASNALSQGVPGALPLTVGNMTARKEQMMQMGVPEDVATRASLAEVPASALSFIAPLAAPAKIGARALQGATSTQLGNAAAAQASNAILGEAGQKQAIMDPWALQNATPSAVLGGALGAFLGPRAGRAVQTPADLSNIRYAGVEADLDAMQRNVVPEQMPTQEFVTAALAPGATRTRQETAQAIKQRRADVTQAFEDAQTQGGVLRRDTFDPDKPEAAIPATDVTGTVFADPAQLGVARRAGADPRAGEPNVQYAETLADTARQARRAGNIELADRLDREAALVMPDPTRNQFARGRLIRTPSPEDVETASQRQVVPLEPPQRPEGATYDQPAVRVGGDLPTPDTVMVGGSQAPRPTDMRVETAAEAAARVYGQEQGRANDIPYTPRTPEIPEPLALPAPGKTASSADQLIRPSQVIEQTPRGQGVTTPTRAIIGRQEPSAGARPLEPPVAPRAADVAPTVSRETPPPKEMPDAVQRQGQEAAQEVASEAPPRAAPDITPESVKGRKVKVEVNLADGKKGTAEVDAAKWLADIDRKDAAYRMLRDCLTKR